MRFCIIAVVFTLTISTASFGGADGLPVLPDLKKLNQYYAQDITRNLRFLEARPGNHELMVRIFVLLNAAGQSDHAAEWLEAVKKSGISQLEIDGLLEQARARYNLQLTIEGPADENNEPYHWITGPEKAALIYEAENNMDKAAEEYSVLFKSSRNPEYLARAAERYLWANNSSKALSPLLQLLNFRPTDRNLLLQIARIFSWNNNPIKAAEFFAKAQKIRYSQDVAIEHLQAASASPDNPETTALFESYLARHPQDFKIKALFSQLLSAQNQREKAFQVISSIPVRQLDPGGLLLLAEEHRSRGNATEAVELALAGLKKTSGKDFQSLFYFYNLLAYAYEAKTEYSQALSASKSALENLITRKTGININTARDYRVALMQLQGSVLRRISGDSDALAAYQEILKIAPEDTTALLFMGEYSRNQSNLSQAQNYFEKAARLAPDDSYIMWSLADIYIKTGDYWKARGILEKLSQQPDFKDSEMLAEAWKQTGAWHLLAGHYMGNRERMLSENLEGLLEALERSGRKKEAADIIYDGLIDQPFDTSLEARLSGLAGHAPNVWQKYQTSKESLIAGYYNRMIASITETLDKSPENNSLRAQRADIFNYSGNLKAALEDYRQIIQSEPATLSYLSRTAELAEWTSDWRTGRNVRNKIKQLEPQNATNTLRLAQAYYYLRDFRKAYEICEEIEVSEQKDSKEFFKIAYPVYSRAGEFKRARQVLVEAENNPQLDSEDQKLLKENFSSLKRDIGPVIRVDSGYFHDTAEISRATSNLYSRFAVENNRFAEVTVKDTALKRKNNTQRPFRGSEVTFSFTRVSLDNQLTLSLPAMIAKNGSASKLYLPGLSYSKFYDRSQTGVSFARLPVYDSPEALLQKLYTDNFSLWHSTEIARNTTLRAEGFSRRNSMGYNSTGGSLSVQKNLQYAPFRAVRYTYSFEDGDSEDSDLFYLDDYNQFHQISWLGDYVIKFGKNRLVKFFWETFAGLNYKGDPVYGLNFWLEGEAVNSFYYRIYGGIYSSERNRFDTTDGYRAYNTGLSLEKRFW